MDSENGSPAEFVKTRYRKRIADDLISKNLKAFGGVYITGPKWCGKSWTGMYHSNSFFLVNEEDSPDYARRHPKDVLKGYSPRLIDEWQIVPKLWDEARRAVDFSDGPGRFIFTGSAAPPATR
ncbi:MAG: AAA family ATPase [Candidatus Methanoplasma sp.]|nr:AAA family ATPase [Candidatus Methanoplasma sp.]